MIKSLVRSLIMLSGISLATLHAESSSPVPVVRDGKTCIWLDISPAQATECAAAIADFRRCITAISGAEIGDRPLDGAIPLKLQISAPSKGLTEFEEHRLAGDYETTVKPDGITVTATSPLGLINSIYGLLDTWGCRWVFPGSLGEVLPKLSSLNLPPGSVKTTIASDPRVLAGPPSYFGGKVGDWIRRNRFGKETVVTAHHSWCEIVPPSIYNDPRKKETWHPEYFPLIGGRRVSGLVPSKMQICTTNPAVIKMAVESAKKFFRENPLADTFPCSPEDNFEFCQCPDCVALDSGKTTFGGYPLLTDRVIAFANEVARGIRDEFPGKLVGVLAYNNYTSPPAHIFPEKNVMIDITRMNYDLLHLTGRAPDDSASHFEDLIHSWKKLTPWVYLYEYNPIYWAGGLFCPNYLEYARAIIRDRKLGALGFRSDAGELPFRNKINFLNNYLGIRVAVNAGLDPDEELASVCRAFYGPAGDAMLKYFRLMSGVVASPEILGGGIRNFHRMFTPKMIVEGSDCLGKASALADQSPFKERVRLAFLGNQYLSSYLQGIWQAKAGNYEGSIKAFAAMQRNLDALAGIGAFGGLPSRSSFMEGAALMAYADYLPDQFGFVRQWKLLGPLDNRDRSGEYRSEKFEPVLSWDASVPGMDGKMITWKPYQSPSGFLNFADAFSGQLSKETAFTVYAGVTLKAKKAMSVILQCNSFNSFRVFFGGKPIFYRAGQNLDLPNTCSLPVELKEGENDLIFRCTEAASAPGFPYGLYLRISSSETPNRFPIEGLTMQ